MWGKRECHIFNKTLGCLSTNLGRCTFANPFLTDVKQLRFQIYLGHSCCILEFLVMLLEK